MVYGARSKKFCCCLPVRFGVFVLALAQAVSSGALAGVTYWAVTQDKENLANNYKVISVIVAAVSALLCVVSLLGFIGSLLHRQNLVRIFSYALNFMVGLSIFTGIAAIVLLFVQSKSELIDTCINGSTDQDVIDACHHVDTYRGVTVGLIVFDWILGLWQCWIVSSYVNQLQEEKEAGWRRSAMKTWDEYEQVPRRDSSDAFHHPSTEYPYSFGEKGHSYGGETA